MGTEIAVASVVYNLAGEVSSRPDYLKSTVVKGVLSNDPGGLGTVVRNGQLYGPSSTLRAFYRWASSSTNYGTIGLPTGQLVAVGGVDAELVQPHVPAGVGETIIVSSAEAGAADPTYWARQWIYENRLEDIDEEWVVEYNKDLNEILITFPDTTTETITATNYNYASRYLYVHYTIDDGVEISDTKIFIYRLGSGNSTLDGVVNTNAGYGQFFPFIPFRLNNAFLSDTHFSSAYPQVKNAFKRSVGGDFMDLVEQLEDNEDLGDIDHAYIVFGVSLNTIDTAAKKYLYKFFEMLEATQVGGIDEYDEWVGFQDLLDSIINAWNSWREDPVGSEPTKPTTFALGGNTIRIRGTGSVNSYYDIRIKWKRISHGSGSGAGKPGAKKGDIWIEYTGKDDIYRTVYTDHGTRAIKQKTGESHNMRIYRQTSDSTYTFLNILGAEHENFVYQGTAVKTNVLQALTDGDESGFLIPLHFDTWAQLPIVDRNQMSVACCYAVFNCYEVYKTKWYESGIFRIFLVIIIAIASVVFTGGAGIGLLGTHISVGSAFGLSGMTAAIVGSIANALAALVLSMVLELVLKNLGPLGSIISTVLMIVVGQVATSFSTGALTINWGDLMRAENLIKMTDAVVGAGADFINQDTLNLQQDLLDYEENTKRESLKIQQAYFEEFGYGAQIIDPLMFVDSTTNPNFEHSDTFLTRTLLTGSEIAEMSRDLIYEFPSLSLKLPDAFT